MRRTAAAFLTLAALAGVVSPAAAQDVSGTWELAYTMETPRGSMERTLVVHLTQDGATLTGTAEMPAMRRPGGGDAGQTRTVELSDGSVDGSHVTFAITLGRGQRTFTMTFAGTVDGDAMEGTVTAPMGGETPFTGTRRKDG